MKPLVLPFCRLSRCLTLGVLTKVIFQFVFVQVSSSPIRLVVPFASTHIPLLLESS
jgi:hypothetical protein